MRSKIRLLFGATLLATFGCDPTGAGGTLALSINATSVVVPAAGSPLPELDLDIAGPGGVTVDVPLCDPDPSGHGTVPFATEQWNGSAWVLKHITIPGPCDYAHPDSGPDPPSKLGPIAIVSLCSGGGWRRGWGRRSIRRM